MLLHLPGIQDADEPDGKAGPVLSGSRILDRGCHVAILYLPNDGGDAWITCYKTNPI